MPWWDLEYEHKHASVTLVQVDLANSSDWCATRPADTIAQKVESASRRAELPALLDVRLRYLGFATVYWAGDGGLFAKYGDANPQAMGRIAEETFKAFYYWGQKGAGCLGLRASATFIPDLIIDANPGYWYSPALNSFLKNERLLARKGHFVVTEALFDKMKSYHSAPNPESPDAFFAPLEDADGWEQAKMGRRYKYNRPLLGSSD
jgi:hypothetical protein